MPLRVNNNIAAINANRRLNANTRDASMRYERLSSGLRINRAADDAAGLSVREGMRAEISGLTVDLSNAEQASNLLQVAENEIENIQSSEASISDADVASEVSALTRSQILSQAATAMLANTKVQPQLALSLLA